MLQLFNYNDNAITFIKKDGATFMNAAEMARPFGKAKSPKFWLNNSSTTRFIAELSEVRFLTSSDLVSVRHGNNGGTWLHEDVAIEFARWLSPSFAIWCNDRIKELLTVGVTATPEMLYKLLQEPENVVKVFEELSRMRKMVDRANRDVGLMKIQHDIKDHNITRLKKDQERLNSLLGSKSTVSTNTIAMELGISAIKLNKFLEKARIIYKSSGDWAITSFYRGMGFHAIKTFTFTNEIGGITTKHHLCWTEKGRDFIKLKYESSNR